MAKKTIVITGANRGIGRQLALAYAAPEVNLILIARQRAQLAAVADECQQQGAKAFFEIFDIREAAPLNDYLLTIDKEMPVDLVIANAGVSSTLQPDWQQETPADLEQTFAINWQGTINTINPLIKPMIQRNNGQIAIMSSLAGLRGLPQSPGYCASKAALHVYGQSLRAWLSRYQVQVSVVFPGYIKTQMSDKLTGPKPFLLSSEKAAKIIQKGLSKNKANIAFPWQLHWLMRLAGALPGKVVDTVLNRFESHVSEG